MPDVSALICFILFQIILIYCIICVSRLITGSDGLVVPENVIFQKTNEIYTNDAHHICA